MTLSEWFELGRLIATVLTALVSIVGFGGVVWTIRQRTESDNRSEWWSRYTWVEEQLDGDYRKQMLGWKHMEILLDSPLATKSEGAIIQALSIEAATRDNGDEQEEQEDDDDDQHATGTEDSVDER
ncbi:hypothetical protein [Corynebacterium sp. A21]|uniref:hypothetical protein n=1 Tax=Corynebacterium sp. A21 TaxID=3457318 RepID=UPI003FD248C6